MHYHYARVGMREHMAEIPMQNTILMLKVSHRKRDNVGYGMFADQQMLIVYQIVYYNAMVLAKLSYLFFYLRIFVTEAFRLAAWICMGCALSYWLGSMLQIFLICKPFAKNWDTTLEGHCANQNVAFSTIGAFNLVTDILIMLLPVHFIRKLQMSPATKLGLYVIFGLGFLYVFSLFFFFFFALYTGASANETAFRQSPSFAFTSSPPSILPISHTP